MKERRYSCYRQEEVWAMLYQQQATFGVKVHDGSVCGNSVALTHEGVMQWAVILARSSDWYTFSLNCVERWHHEVSCIVCGTHDSCVPVPVLAMDAGRWYQPLETRIKDLTPKLNAHGKPIDTFEQRRKTRYGHAMLLGALLCERADAKKRLASLPPSTQRRILAQVRALRLRRQGRPLKVKESSNHKEA
jgi:hypothetical protein